MAFCGTFHTLCLSNNGIVHTFGFNSGGQLGLGHNESEFIPKQITLLPMIKHIACGYYFTVCADHEGKVWSFGTNDYSQLGIGGKKNVNTPHEVKGLPPIHQISCGAAHTILIGINSDLWAFGTNLFGQLCNGESGEGESFPIKTPYSNIISISTGHAFSIFQDKKGDFYGCGRNDYGQLGFGHQTNQIKPEKITNVSNIVHTSSGAHHLLLLDINGKVYSTGHNSFGQLGLGHRENVCTFTLIDNLPKITTIATASYCSMLIDEDGNLWNFGKNENGQLFLGDARNRGYPTKVTKLSNIKYITGGYDHCIARDYNGNIFVAGSNTHGQLGVEENICKEHSTIPIQFDKKYISIWGDFEEINNKWRNCFELLKWKEFEIIEISKIEKQILQIKSKNSKNFNLEFPKHPFESWRDVDQFLNKKLNEIKLFYDNKLKSSSNYGNKLSLEKSIELENELQNLKEQMEKIQIRIKEIENLLAPALFSGDNQSNSSNKRGNDQTILENNFISLQQLCNDVKLFSINEVHMNKEIFDLFQLKSLEDFNESDILKVLWKMDLIHHQELFELNHINGKILLQTDMLSWKEFGFSNRDIYALFYFIDLMKSSNYYTTLSPNYSLDCPICLHNTPEKTLHLLNEYDISLDSQIILRNNYTAPILAYVNSLKDFNIPYFSLEGKQIINKLQQWKLLHIENHIQPLNK